MTATATSERRSEPRPPVRRRPLGATWWGLLRIAIGWVFLWAFFDKLFGLGFATCRNPRTGDIDVMCDAAFAEGGSPTFRFLEFGTEQSHTGDLFEWLAPSSPTSPNIVDWVFMISLLAIGVGLVFGVAARLAAIGAAVLLVLMYLAGFVWPETNPFLDEHLIYALALLGVAFTGAGRYLGLGEWWNRLPPVQRLPILQS